MITKIHADVKRAGKIFGQGQLTYAKGHPLSNDAFFFQNGPSNDGWTPPAAGGRGGATAPPAGSAESARNLHLWMGRPFPPAHLIPVTVYSTPKLSSSLTASYPSSGGSLAPHQIDLRSSLAVRRDPQPRKSPKR